ncbi:MAG: ankyrin repeat domain-containing protein [Thermodesulfobacteriota bacterium]
MTPESAKEKTYTRQAAVLTLTSMASTGILLLFYAVGPQSGMEALVLIVPWFLSLIVHLVLTVPALIFAWKSRAHLRLSWIYTYFLLFWGLTGWYLVLANNIDILIARQFDTWQHPGEADLFNDLEQLRMAALQRHPLDPAVLDRTKKLIRNGADVNHRQPGSRRSLLAEAAAIGDSDLVAAMIAAGAEIQGNEAEGADPLMEAVRNRHATVTRMLLKYGANPEHARYAAETPLITAVRNQDPETVGYLLEGGALPDHHPESGLPALQIAAVNGDAVTVRLLVDAGADPHRSLFGSSTAMIRAVEADCSACVRILLDAGAGFSGKTGDGDGPLALAFKRHRPDMTAVILNAGQDRLHAPTRFGTDAYNDMFAAIRKTDREALEFYLQAGVPPDLLDANRQTLLLDLAGRQYQRPEISPESEVAAAEILFRHKADLNIRDPRGKTALIKSLESGALELARWLIENGADVNAAAEEGVTALHTAVWHGHERLALTLMDAGADVNARTRMGMNSETPLEAAMKKGTPGLVARMRKVGSAGI